MMLRISPGGSSIDMNASYQVFVDKIQDLSIYRASWLSLHSMIMHG